MSLRPLVVCLLAAGCVSQSALEKAEEAFLQAFGPNDVVEVDGGTRCNPVPVVLEGTVHPGYAGQTLAGTLLLGEVSEEVRVDVTGGGNWSVEVGEVSCTNITGRCTVEAIVTVISVEDSDTYEGTSRFEITVEDDRLEMFPDGDGDGYGSDSAAAELVCDTRGYVEGQGDCDDTLASVNEGVSVDACNDVDDDCDGSTDEDGVFTNYYPDLDGDGFGAEGGAAELRCDIPGAAEMLAPNDADCVDDPSLDPYAEAINPEADEMCDGFDNDCDGGIDDDDPDGPDDGLSYFLDKDGDGAFHDQQEFRCNVPGVQGMDYILTAPASGDEDCDDNDAALNRQDLDLDSFDTCEGDCDDGTFAINPDAEELLGNSIDEDCNGSIDCYEDLDNDEFGSLVDIENALPVPLRCSEAANGFAENSNDCLDEASADGANAFPGNPAGDDPSDDLDNDCSSFLACFVDDDEDGFGGTGVEEITVSATNGRGDCDAQDGLATSNTDCEDGDEGINPGAAELVADGVDQDCDGLDSCYADRDQDGFGSMNEVDDNAAAPGACDNPTLRLADDNTDCDDTDDQTFPGGIDIPGDDVDQDCLNGYFCFVDNDGDGFGTTVTADFIDTCSTATGASRFDNDCDDIPGSGSDINPNGTEVPGNAVDEDCSTDYDCYEDADNDGYAELAADIVTTTDPCDLLPGGGGASTPSTVGTDIDCNDALSAYAPGAPEAVGDPDFDCDGFIDCYEDVDNDGFGSITTTSIDVTNPGDGSVCTAADFASLNSDDCRDEDEFSYPGAPEIACDGVEQDCDLTPTADARVAIVTGPTFEPTDTTFDGLPEAQLQAAFDAAGPGDIVRLCGTDTYLGTFTIDEPFTVEGEGATLDGGNTNAPPVVDSCDSLTPGSVLTLDLSSAGASTTELWDLTIQGGCEPSSTDDYGGALDVIGPTIAPSVALDLTNVVVTRNSALLGGGVAATGFVDVTWTDGSASVNAADSGGALYVGPGATAALTDTVGIIPFMDANTANANGGAIFADGEVVASNIQVSNNRAFASGGGMYVTGTATLNDSMVDTNQADVSGGGMYVTGTATLNDSMVDTNQADVSGGGMYVTGTATLNDSMVDTNQADVSGGGVYATGTFTMQSPDPSGSTCSLSSNSVTTAGGGFGDALYTNDGMSIIDDCTLSGSTSSTQDGVYVTAFANLSLSAITAGVDSDIVCSSDVLAGNPYDSSAVSNCTAFGCTP